MDMNIENRLFRGLVIPTIILWSTVVVLPCVVCWLIGEQHGFQAMFLIGTIGFIYLMCLGIIISTGIYLSVAIYFYLKRNPRFIHCCGGISIYGALLAGVISMIGMVDGSLWVFLPISIPLTIYFLYWVEWIKKHISIRKVCRMTVLTLVISVIIPVSCVYIFLF